LQRIFRAATRVHESKRRDIRRGDSLRGAAVRAALWHAPDLRGYLASEGKRAVALDFDRATQTLGASDSAILAVPPWIANDLVPGLVTPDEFRGILNVHFQIEPPRGQPA